MKYMVNQCDIYNSFSVIGTNVVFDNLVSAEAYRKAEYLRISGKYYFYIQIINN